MSFNRRTFLGVLAVGGVVTASRGFAAAAPTAVKVYKDPTCGCCANWVKHIEANGFVASVETVKDLAPLKRSLGIPDALQSCHTAVVNGYALEGHVPAREITRLLAEKPKARGLAVPGMIVGSPGMEVEGQAADPYDVVLINSDGTHKTFATYK